MFSIVEERRGDRAAVETLARLALGDRLTDSPAARMRAGANPAPGLSMVAIEDGEPVGTIRYWPVAIGRVRAIQLGPVAIRPDRRGLGLGRLLIRESLARARSLGHRVVVLIGDPSIYGRYGFQPAAPLGIVLPESGDRERLQALALAPGALEGLSGTIRPDTVRRPRSGRAAGPVSRSAAPRAWR